VADVNANIGVNIDASNALAQLKSLQRQLAQFHTSVAKSSSAAATAQANLQKNLVNSINATGAFTAELRTVRTTSEAFTDSLEKNKFSMREYFRYAGAATKTFGKTFRSEFDTIGKVAEDRVKKLQTQYIKLGRDSSGAMKAIAVIPNQLDLSNHSTQLQLAAQRQAIFNQLLKQGSTNLLNFGKNTQWAGRQLMVGFTLPLASLGMVASKSFMDMETAALKFRKVYGDLLTPKAETQKALENVKELAKEFTKYGIAVSTTVGLAAEAAAAGFQGLDLQRQTTEATRLSILGQIDAQQALGTTIALQNAFKMSSEDLADSINFLNAVENQTVVSLDDITTAIPKVAPVIQQLGGDVKDLAFFMTAMKQGGINASEGANALKSGLASLINPTNTASKMLAGMGININNIVESNKGDLKATVIGFAEALDTLDPLNRARAIEQMFGKFQFARLSALFSNVIADGTQASRVLDLAGASIEELAELSESELGMTADSAMNKFKKSVEDLKVALVPVGKAFLEAVTPIVEFVGNLLEKFSGLSDGTKKAITILTIAIGGIGPVALMAFGLLANGLANIIKLFGTLRNGYLRLTGQSQVLGEQTQYMTNEQLEAAAAAHSLNQSHANLTQTFTAESSAVRSLIAAYTDATRAASAFALANPGMMLPARGKAPKKLAVGGILKGPGTGTSDSIPAMLSNGEAIIPAKNVRKYPSMVAGLISGNIPGFRRGGRALTEADSTFISSIASSAPERSQSGISAFLTKELERMPETIVQEFKILVTTMAEEIRLSGTALEKNLKEFRSRYISTMNQQDEVQFSHIGAGRKVTAGDLNQSGAVAGDAKTQERLNYFIDKVGPDVALDLKNGFAAELTGFLNNAMGGAGASLEDVIQDSIVGGSEKWRKSIEIGGGTFENLGEDLQRFDSRFTQNLQSAYDRGGRIIVDTQSQIEELRAKAIAKGETFDDRIYVALDTITNETLQNVGTLRQGLDRVFEEAIQTITEIRYNGLTDEQALALGPDFMGRGKVSKDGRITPGATSSRRRFGGGGDFRNIPESSFINTATQDARAYNSQIEARTQDIYVTSRDRTSPHELAPKDGRDDAIAYDKAREKALAKRRKRRVAQRPQGPAPIGVAPQSGARMLPIVSQPTQDDLRRTRRRDKVRSVKGKVARSMRGGRGMAASSALMVGSQFLPGKAGQIAGQASGLLFAVQALTMLPGPLKIAAAAVIAGIGVYKLFSIATERARLKIEGLGDVATMSKEKLDTLGSFFGVTVRTLSRENLKSGNTLSPIGATQRSAVDQLKATEDFQKNFKNDINALRSASVKDAEIIFKALAIRLKGSGFASEQIKTIIQALQEEAGKTSIELDFKDIGVASAKKVETQATIIGRRLSSIIEKEVSSLNMDETIPFDQLRFIGISESVRAQIFTYGSALSAVLDGLVLQFQSGEMAVNEYTAGVDSLSDAILRMPKATQTVLISKMAEQLGADAYYAIQGIDDLNARLQATLAISMSIISIDSPLIKVLQTTKDSKVIREILEGLKTRTENFLKAFQDADPLTGNTVEETVGGASEGVDKLSESSKAYLKILQKEIDALKAKQEANKKSNDEMQRQIDLQLKQQDLTNKMKQEQIRGNYLEAALLGQEQRKNTIEFNQGTADNKLADVLDRLEKRLKEVEGGANLTKAEDKKVKEFKKEKGRKAAAGGYISNYMGGGNVSGPGTKTSDSIPAMLSDGEYVIKADSVQKYGVGTFDLLNAQRFAKGGKAKKKKTPSGWDLKWMDTMGPKGWKPFDLPPVYDNRISPRNPSMLQPPPSSNNLGNGLEDTLFGPKSWTFDSNASKMPIWDRDRQPNSSIPLAMGGLVPGYKDGGAAKDGWLQKWARGISGQPASEMLGVAPLLRLIAGIGGKGDKLGAAMAPLSFAGMGVGPKIAGNLGKTAFAIPNKLYQLRNKAKVNSMIKSGMWHGSQPTGYRGEEYLQGTNILDGAQSNDPYYGMGFFGTSSKGEADLYAGGYNSFSNWGESFGSINQIIGAPKGKYIDFTKKPGSLKWQDYSLAKALGATKNSSIFDLMPENLGSIMSSEGMTGAIMNRVNTGAVPKDIEGAKWLSWNNPAGVITKEKRAMGGMVNLPKFHDWNGPVPGTYGQELPAVLKSGTEGIYQEGYINDLKQAASNTTNSSSSVYNVSMNINGADSDPKQIAEEVMKKMQVLTNKNNKMNVGLR
jgi:TP901 family phage tail tape measure protein